ncbi:hypothetical protein B0H13DRAFT_1921712 [Mycena leptocephala]|nr:hypothetical protein B0H13DRAFT_1921712 [Mycena leptocephala]
MTIFLTLLKKQSGALCVAKYGRDFVATRDRTDQEASIYSFKAVEEDLWWFQSERRQEARVMPSVVFGQVKNVFAMLQCPTGVTCDAQTVFYKQLRTLRDIINVDLNATPGFVGGSWFDVGVGGWPTRRKTSFFALQVMLKADSAQEAGEFKTMFCDTDVAGMIIKLNVTMQRRESTEFARVKKAAFRSSGLATHATVRELSARSVGGGQIVKQDAKSPLRGKEEMLLCLPPCCHWLGLRALTPFPMSFMTATSSHDATVHQPVEVLEEIFFYAIDPTDPVWFDALNSLLAIGRVCKRWQGIVRKHRELWTTVTIARCMTEDWIKTWLERVGPSNFALRIDARPYKGIRVGETRSSRPVSSRSMADFLSNVLPYVRGHFAQVEALRIEGLEESSLATILHTISDFPSTALIDLTIECTPSATVEASLVLPLVGQIKRLKLHDFRPLWTSPQFYHAITVVDLASISANPNVSCTEWYDGPPLYLSHLTNLRLAYGGLSNIGWLQNLVVDEILTFGLHLSVGASLSMAVTWVPHICGVAKQVGLNTLDLSGPDTVPFLSLFRSASSFDTRLSTGASTQLARFLDAPNPELMFPRLEVLLIVGEVTAEEARTMLVGRFASLKLIHAKVYRKGYSKDYVEWTVENQEVVHKYSASAGNKKFMNVALRWQKEKARRVP